MTLFTIARIWKQPSSQQENQEDVVYTHTHTHTHRILLGQKSEILPFATWMDLEDIKLTAISQTEKDKYYMLSFICRI